VQILDTFSNLLLIDFKDACSTDAEEIKQFVKESTEELTRYREQANIQGIEKIYNEFKNCNTLKKIVTTCAKLNDYKTYIGDPRNLSDVFIYDTAGVKLCLLTAFTEFNLKAIVSCPEWVVNGNKMKKYLLTMFNIIYSLGLKIYNIKRKPDINVSEFSSTLIKHIGEIKKHINGGRGCDDAFKAIEDSLGLLENNFDTYYTDFIRSQNPTIMIESFILDVSKTTPASPKLTQQFAKIINFYKSKSNGRPKDPKLNSVFEALTENMGKLDGLSDQK
jgi:hypothetical protein